jgi:hypothetical protein
MITIDRFIDFIRGYDLYPPIITLYPHWVILTFQLNDILFGIQRLLLLVRWGVEHYTQVLGGTREYLHGESKLKHCS